jgi:hypothetical protein
MRTVRQLARDAGIVPTCGNCLYVPTGACDTLAETTEEPCCYCKAAAGIAYWFPNPETRSRMAAAEVKP